MPDEPPDAQDAGSGGGAPHRDPADRDIGYLVDMLENAKRALQHVAGKDRAVFHADRLMQDAVIYRLLIVGEAARNVTETTRLQFPDLPWRKINAMRNVLVHDYKGVELKYVWEVIESHAPQMIALIQAHLDARGIRPSPPPTTP
jgi:uncharacterized protein with HEPN domain